MEKRIRRRSVVPVWAEVLVPTLCLCICACNVLERDMETASESGTGMLADSSARTNVCQWSDDPSEPRCVLLGSGLTNAISDAENGDAFAAYRLATHYFRCPGRDEELRYHWMMRGAELGNARCQYELALAIRYGHYGGSLAGFGSTPQEAAKELIERAANEIPSAFWSLGCMFESGYFGKVDITNAIVSFEKSADACYLSASHLASLLPLTDFTNRMERAYHWASMATTYRHPGSCTGDEMWKLRDKLAPDICLTTLRRIWSRVDQEIDALKNDTCEFESLPFSFGYGRYSDIRKRRLDRGMRAVDVREAEHRSEILKSRAVEPSVDAATESVGK